jgi:guanosine-3',5'-bis(diphosphate) 3'-pyrophosphohydrolase
MSRVKGYTRGDGTQVSPHIRRASQYAARQHKGQFRGDGKTPYITHPLGVAKILHEAGIYDDDTILAAILHDTIEDTGTTKKDIANLFGERVANFVHEVTNDPAHDKAQTKFVQITESKTRSIQANMVKVADKTYNLRDMTASPPNWTREKKIAKTEHARQVVNAMPFVPKRLRAMFDVAYKEAMTTIS